MSNESKSTDDILNVSLKSENDQQEEWSLQINELQNKIIEHENNALNDRQKIIDLEEHLQATTDERDNYKNQIAKLQKELNETKKRSGSGGPKGSSVEKTKLCKNQALQIEALTEQVTSLKEIVSITKDLLDIRNMEVKHLQDQISCMELKFKAEKERHLLMHNKLDKMVQMNVQLKKEYESQLSLFTKLRDTYNEREKLRNTQVPLQEEVPKEINGEEN